MLYFVELRPLRSPIPGKTANILLGYLYTRR